MTEKKGSVGVTVILISLVLCFSAFAETITLKSGTKFEARILQKTDQYIIVDWQGQNIRYSLNEVDNIEDNSSLPKIKKEDVDSASKSEISPSLESRVTEPQQVLEYLNKSEFIMKSVNKEIAEKQVLLAQASRTKNMEKMRAITTEMINIFAEHKQQFSALSVPPSCEELYSATLKWYQLQEDIHNELIKGNIQQSKLLTQQLIECTVKMEQESNRLIQYYEQ